jgi:hypothetical protein
MNEKRNETTAKTNRWNQPLKTKPTTRNLKPTLKPTQQTNAR